MRCKKVITKQTNTRESNTTICVRQAAKHTVVEASTDERVKYLLAGYEHFTTTHVDMLKEKLRMLTRKRGKVFQSYFSRI